MTAFSPQVNAAFNKLAAISRQRKLIAEELAPLVLADPGASAETKALAKKFLAVVEQTEAA